MRKTLAVSAMCTALAFASAAVAVAEPYSNEIKRFEVTIPEGWKYAAGSDGLIDLILASPRVETTSGLCILMSREVADTRKMTQAEINELTKGQVNEAFWLAILQDKNVKDMKVQTRDEMRKDRIVYLATVSATSMYGGKEMPLHAEMALHVIPGLSFMGQCAVQQAQVAAEEADIKTVIDTYNPLGPGVIAKVDPPQPAQGTAVLVLYAGPRFAGAHHDVMQDIPNLAAAGWNTVTASFALKGPGLWEICDRINYQGNCRVVAGVESATMGGRPLRIGSARRVASDPRSVLGIANEALSLGLAELVKRASTRR